VGINKKLKKYLETMVELEASDLHLRSGSEPVYRVNGKLKTVEHFSKISQDEIEKISEDIFNEKHRKIFERKKEVDLSFSVEGLARFRVNVFQQLGSMKIVMRLVLDKVKGFSELNLPATFKKIASSSRGLVLVTGTTGSGKSTTLAAMIDYINNNYSKHVITVEDPIEYLHRDVKSMISQRELGVDTYSYSAALKHVVRQDPDVILIGEMRDIETMQAALTAAQIGNLVISTTHTTNASQTISRVVDVFPAHKQNHIRLMLADTLTAIISQRLLPRKDKVGMIPAIEVLIATGTIRSLIEEKNVNEITERMKKGDYYGMQTFNKSLENLYKSGKITLEDAKKFATNAEDLMLNIRGIKSDSGAEL